MSSVHLKKNLVPGATLKFTVAEARYPVEISDGETAAQHDADLTDSEPTVSLAELVRIF